MTTIKVEYTFTVEDDFFKRIFDLRNRGYTCREAITHACYSYPYDFIVRLDDNILTDCIGAKYDEWLKEKRKYENNTSD